jgi:hypothetical protein
MLANDVPSFRDDATEPSRCSIGRAHNSEVENINDSKVLQSVQSIFEHLLNQAC